ncbi:MAG: hypothetical protein GSR75_02280 [Desulfurococcales archaeon]|nr:hypothetical protein [Desulfurococcales archaeon]
MKESTISIDKIIKEIVDEIDGIANELEKKLNGKVIHLIFHELASITRDVVDDLEFYMHEKHKCKVDEDLYVILHTMGGDADAAYHIGVRLQSYVPEDKKLYVVVLRYAKSAGTLLACASDEILLTPIAELGPIDPQIYVRETGRWISAKAIAGSLKQVIETLKEAGVSDAQVTKELIDRIPIVELGHYDSLIEHIQHLAEDLLKKRMFRDSESVAGEVASRLVKSYMYHGQVIHNEEAERIGIRVKTLEEDSLNLVYQYYKKIRELFDTLDRYLEPFLTVIREGLPPGPIIEKCETHYGLIYMPSTQLFQQLSNLS